MGDHPPFLTKQIYHKIARASKFQITKMAHAFSIFGRIKRIAHLGFLYLTFNTSSA